MADFDAILRKALASRPGAPGEERRKIYERARQALVRQLTGFEPPLPPEDISRQRLALEGAIRRVESEVAANGGVLPTPDASAAQSEPMAPSLTPSPAPASPVTTPAPTLDVPPTTPPASTVTPAAPVPSEPPSFQPSSPPPATAAPITAAPAVEMPRADAPRFDPPPTFDDPEPVAVDDPKSMDLPDFEPERSQPDPVPPKKSGGGMAVLLGVLALLILAGGGTAAWQLGLLDPYLNRVAPEVAEQPAEDVLEEAPEVRTVGSDPTRSSERLLPDNQGAVEDTPPEPEPPAEDVAAVEPETPALPVAQTAILYEEGLTPDADGFTAPGRAVWRLDETGASPAVVGTIEIPARGILMNLRISLNLDDALPATHLIEFDFDLSEAFPASSVAELVGVVVKPQEQSGGDPLRGAIVDLGDGVFWQALAAGEADQAVNVPLLRDGRWFDLPVLYDDNRRAIITFEKGSDGVAIFQQALNAWSN